MSSNVESLQRRIRVLDGVRGLAILMVLALHFYLLEGPIIVQHPILGPILTKLAVAGLYGVELFFVLSGFLITGILLDSRGSSHYFRNFYMRRFLRIFPLYYSVLFILFFIIPVLTQFDAAAESMRSRQMWLWTYLSNLPFAGGGWDRSGIFRLGHLWSLCVEEHYYFVWPLLVWALSRKALTRVCLGILVAAATVRTLGALFPDALPIIFKWTTITKLDGLAMGSMLAIFIRDTKTFQSIALASRKGIPLLGTAFCVFIFIPRRFWDQVWFTPAETISVCFFGAFLVVMSGAREGSIARKVCENPILVAFGKYSYAIYVIHNLLLPSFQRMLQPERLAAEWSSPLLAQSVFHIACGSCSFVLAFASWHLYEKHFLKLKKYFESSRGSSAVKAGGLSIRKKVSLMPANCPPASRPSP